MLNQTKITYMVYIRDRFYKINIFIKHDSMEFFVDALKY